MICDKSCELATTVAFDLGSVNPGKGRPIKMRATGIDASLSITDGTTNTAADALMTIVAPAGTVEFELPSDVNRYIKASFSAGSLAVMLDVQTAS